MRKYLSLKRQNETAVDVGAWRRRSSQFSYLRASVCKSLSWNYGQPVSMCPAVITLTERIQSRMEYENENAGIELLLAHMNIEDFIQVAEDFYCVGEEVEAGVSFEESFSQEDMDEIEETPQDLISHVQNPGKVRYGTASDLLDFVNMVSNIPSSSLLEVGEEMGVLLNKTDMVIKEGHYRIDLDVLLFPWKLTYKPPGPGHVPKGSFGKVHLAQDTKTRKRMACKLVVVFTPVGGYNGHAFPYGNLCSFITYLNFIFVPAASNIVLMSAKAVLVDFGLTVQMKDDVYVPRDLRGTEMYMSPELVLCRGHNTKTDIYSLGTTIIHMMSGSPPWVRRYPRTAYPSYLYIIHKQAPPLEDIPESCSPAMRRLLEHALDRVPARRSSATELLNEEALHPSREDQPRCWSLDSALEEGTHPLLRQHSQLSESTQDSSLYTEDSGHSKKKGSLYIDLGALAGYYNLVRGPPSSEYG
ncbi:hypothetical protein cypCar_00004461 [Cyprinus carpio]|nr:hypothetical protein cypCar_00004461 [Cyprinus carpio]